MEPTFSRFDLNGEAELLAADDARVPKAIPTNIACESQKIRENDHANNFGLIRVILATLVILAHSPQMLDGNSSRELLTRAFGGLSFGEFAVDGFFLVSGYLVTKSLTSSTSISNYLFKRALRIYPGFILAYLVCLFIVAPLGGGSNGLSQNYIETFFRLGLLHPPSAADAFVGLPWPTLDGSMWTIAYEFRCYILLIAIAKCGVLQRPWLLAVLTASLFLICCMHISPNASRLTPVFGTVADNSRFFAIFCCGAMFYVMRQKIAYSAATASLCFLLLIPFMFDQNLVEIALATLGGYCIFWFALRVKLRRISLILDKCDVSYGMYLYGWPIQNLLIWHFRTISPWILFSCATILAIATALLSWFLIEEPFLRLKRIPRRRQRMVVEDGEPVSPLANPLP